MLFTAVISPNKWALAEELLVNSLWCWVFFLFGMSNLCFADSFFLCPSQVSVFLWGHNCLMLFHCLKANRDTYTAAQQSPPVVFLKFWKITQHQKDNGKPRTIWPSASMLPWGSITACIMELLWKFTAAKNKAINDFNRSMRKSFFPNEGCCLNPGRSNLNWTKEQTKDDLETCGRTNAWLRTVQWFKLTTFKPKFF